MQPRKLHLVSFDNPFPPNYGGVIEVYFKIKALHQLGVEIYLHCFFEHRKEHHQQLERLVREVYYYKVRSNPLLLFSSLPFSVVTRNHPDFIGNILKQQAPILFESLKTTFLINHPKLKNYNKFLRLHNLEQNYFGGLAKSETNLFRKWIFQLESQKYLRYESRMSGFNAVFCLSQFEQIHVDKFPNTKSEYIPVFHGNEFVQNLSGFGKYALYHGDLRMADNLRVAHFLIESFKELPHLKLIIASNSGEKKVRKWIGKASNISYESINDFSHLQQLFSEAHINLIYSFQKSGTKLKLLNSLYNSRFCVINENIIDDSIVAELCIKATTKTELITTLELLFIKPYTDYSRRKEVLEEYMNDLKNAQRLLSKLN